MTFVLSALAPPVTRRSYFSLTTLIFAATIAGVVIGLQWPKIGLALEPCANVFLRLVQSIVAPLIFATLVGGLAGADLKSVGRIGLKAAAFFLVVSTIAMLLGYSAAVLVRPGAGVVSAAGSSPVTASQPRLGDILESAVPNSIIDAMARGDVLQIVIFSLLFGAACATLGKKSDPVIGFVNALAAVMLRYTRYVMYVAPLGVMAAMAVTVARNGTRMLFSLGSFVVTTCAAEAIYLVAVLLPIALVARVPLRPFLRAVRSPAALAFSTASSNAAFPLGLENLEALGVPKQIAGFVLPAGMSFNLVGTTLFLAVATFFVLQANGVELPIERQALLLLTLMLTSKGVAAVPRASYIILTATIASAGVAPAAAAVVLGVDALLDMVRTSVNFVGNCLATAVIAASERYPLARD